MTDKPARSSFSEFVHAAREDLTLNQRDARQVIFTVIVFLVVAALRHNPQAAQGLDGALATLATQPFGPYVLGLVAAGLAAYGLFALVEARYRRMVIS